MILYNGVIINYHRPNHGEAEDVNVEELTAWQDTVLQGELSNYSPEDTYNADETGLNWRLLPNKTMKFKSKFILIHFKHLYSIDDKSSGNKASKERLTVMLCCNATGTDKRDALIIGKSQNPRAFKGYTRPSNYYSNSNAWMRADIFSEWLEQWDAELSETGRKILLYVDNCSSHPTDLILENIRLRFLPPSTTAKSQVGLTILITINFNCILSLWTRG